MSKLLKDWRDIERIVFWRKKISISHVYGNAHVQTYFLLPVLKSGQIRRRIYIFFIFFILLYFFDANIALFNHIYVWITYYKHLIYKYIGQHVKTIKGLKGYWKDCILVGKKYHLSAMFTEMRECMRRRISCFKAKHLFFEFLSFNFFYFFLCEHNIV
jgi:hypothetical protein